MDENAPSLFFQLLCRLDKDDMFISYEITFFVAVQSLSDPTNQSFNVS